LSLKDGTVKYNEFLRFYYYYIIGMSIYIYCIYKYFSSVVASKGSKSIHQYCTALLTE
jgi:hypothetical protein